MPNLFEPFELRGETLPNRIMISPMATYQARRDGAVSDWHIAHYGRMALGGAGLVMLESTAIAPEGRITYSCTGIWSDDQVAPLRRVATVIRELGAVPAIQLNHTGRKGSFRRPWHNYGPLTEEDLTLRGEAAWPVAGPSPIPLKDGLSPPREMSSADITTSLYSWAAAARRARQAGFGLIEIHAAHGYLANQFLSPVSNIRTDAYGGDLARRMRYLFEVVDAVRSEWPDDRPLLVRISAVDGVDGGWTLDDSIVLARALKGRGVDLIDCSSGGIGGMATVQRVPRGPGFQVPFAETIRREAGIGTVAVGLIRTAEMAADVIGQGKADLVAIGREALVNPNWPNAAHLRLFPTAGYGHWSTESAWWLDMREKSLQAG